MSVDIFPDSRLKNAKGVVRGFHPFGNINYVPTFCANCGIEYGMVPEENCNFVCVLCQPCADKSGPIIGTYMVPDDIFWQEVRNTQIEKYGRELTPLEMAEVLKDDKNILSKLAKDRK